MLGIEQKNHIIGSHSSQFHVIMSHCSLLQRELVMMMPEFFSPSLSRPSCEFRCLCDKCIWLSCSKGCSLMLLVGGILVEGKRWEKEYHSLKMILISQSSITAHYIIQFSLHPPGLRIHDGTIISNYWHLITVNHMRLNSTHASSSNLWFLPPSVFKCCYCTGSRCLTGTKSWNSLVSTEILSLLPLKHDNEGVNQARQME